MIKIEIDTEVADHAEAELFLQEVAKQIIEGFECGIGWKISGESEEESE